MLDAQLVEFAQLFFKGAGFEIGLQVEGLFQKPDNVEVVFAINRAYFSGSLILYRFFGGNLLD